MNETIIRTRFAPSPTGELHLGNARTALFNWLFARGHGGRFVLRSEDTDRARSQDDALARLQADLDWLGLRPDEGPAAGGAHGPYRQCERGARHGELLDFLLERDHAYPCFCSREELAAARKRQMAAGRAPRYPGTCARMSEAEREARRRSGRQATIRFRVPDSGEIEFDDRIHGRQIFELRDIGDFVIARADRTPAFFFANAIDDADMGITHVLRGDDHLTNTPRQLLLLRTLGLDAPAYGHFGLLTNPGGRPLSKREGGVTLAELRRHGYRPEALRNHLARVGLAGVPGDALDDAALMTAFDLSRVSRGPAVHDPDAMAFWQRRIVDSLAVDELLAWIESATDRPQPPWPDRATGRAFAAAVRPNVLFPAEALAWADRIFAGTPEYDREALQEMRDAGAGFFETALAIDGADPARHFRVWAGQVGEATGRRGRHLFRPLRAALTGTLSGPELHEIVALLDVPRTRERLRTAARLADPTAPCGTN